MKKTLIVTGGCGFIGTNISLLAVKKGYHVIAFDSLIRPGTEENVTILKNANVEIIRGDVRNPHDIERLPTKTVGIIHLAANPGIAMSIKSPLFDFSVNALGTLHMLEFARKYTIPFIFASTNKIYSEEINLFPVKEQKTRYEWNFTKRTNLSDGVLSGLTEKGINESFPMDSAGKFPHSPYGVSKATGDLYVQEYFHIYGLPTVVNRMSCIYGLYQKGVEDQGWTDWFVRAKIQGIPLSIYGDGKQVRDALFGTDLAELYLTELEKIEKVKGEVVNVGGGMDNTISLLEAIDYLDSKGGNKLKISFKPWRVADQKIFITDTTKVKKLTGWKPTTSVQKGIDMLWQQYTK